MAVGGGDLFTQLSLDFRQFSEGLRTAVREARRAGDQFQQAFHGGTNSINNTGAATQTLGNDFRDLERIVGGILLSQTFYAGVNAIQDATAAVVTFSGEMEKAQISFEYFLGSSERATGFITNMQDFAAETAFSTTQAMSLSKKLLNARFEANEIRDIMEALNDTAAVSGMAPDTIDRIVLAMTQMKTSGKIMGTELRQLAEANIPVYRILQEELGLTGEQIANIGDLKIPSDIGIAAIFQGLEQFEGAAEKVAQTVPAMWDSIQDNMLMVSQQLFAGPYEALSDLLTKIRDTVDTARGLMTKGGLGAVLEGMVPEGLQDSIRMIGGSLMSLGRTAKQFVAVMKPIAGIMAGAFIHTAAAVLPIVAALARAIVGLAQAAADLIPGVRHFVAAIGMMLIAQTVAKTMMLLWSVLRVGMIAVAVGKAVMTLVTALKWLGLAFLANPVTGGIMIVAAVLAYFALQTEVVTNWLDALMQRLGALGGFDLGGFLQPEHLDNEKWMEEFEGELDKLEDLDPSLMDDFNDSLKDTGDESEDAAKKFKKFVAAFDEVFQVPEPEKLEDPKLDSVLPLPGMDIPDIGEKIEKDIPKLPRKIDLPELVFPPIVLPPFPPFPPIKWPNFSPITTAWEWAMNAIKVKIGEFQLWLEGWKMPNLFPIPNVGPLIDWLGQFGSQLGGILGGIGSRLNQLWNGTWEIMKYPMPVWGQALITGMPLILQPIADFFGGFADNLKSVWQSTLEIMSFPMPAWGEATLVYLQELGPRLAEGLVAVTTGMATILTGAWDTMIQGAGAWGASMLEAISNTSFEWGQALGESLSGMAEAFTSWTSQVSLIMAGLWPLVVQGFKDFGSAAWQVIKDFGKTMVNFWDEHKVTILLVVGAIVAGIILFFTGIPAGVLAAIATLVARVGPAFGRMGPAIMSFIRGIPGQITKLWDKLPSGVQNAVIKMGEKFKALPGIIWEAIKSIPGRIKDVFKDIEIPSFSQIGTSITGSFSKLGDVAGFASGGIIGQDSIVRVGERGKREAIVPLQNDTAMAPFVNSVVKGIMANGGMSQQARGDSGNSELPPMYVGTLIADERGLKELERKMRVIRVSESKRGGSV